MAPAETCHGASCRLPMVCSEAFIQFRPVPHQSFPQSASEDWEPNRLIIRIHPEEGILFKIQAKQPGPNVLLGQVDLHFFYKETFKKAPVEAYETLLLDVMRGDATLFMRSDQIEESWKVIMPVLEAWENSRAKEIPKYPAGTWGQTRRKKLSSGMGGVGSSRSSPTHQTANRRPGLRGV